MAQVIFANQKTPSTTDGFFGHWALTRALLAAGWKYKGSGDATATGVKDTTGNFLLDKWGVGGGVVLLSNVQTGTSSDTMTANTDGTVTHVITGASFTANSVGRFLTITGAVNASNNGTFRIVTFTSGTTVKVFNPASTTETTSVTWTEKQGGANGTITTAGGGAATPGRAIFTVSSGTPFIAPVAFPVLRGSVGDRITIAGGAVGANNGTFIITRVISTTSVEIDNSGALSTGETNNGSLIWTECSPTTQTYPSSITTGVGVGAWYNLQGPSTLKIPVGTNVPTGVFLRGEKVTQTTTGATGTLLGVLTDTSGGLGFLVVEPRLNGTGAQATGVRGWNASANTDTVTGALSGATITTPVSSTPIEYVRELVIWKASNSQGHMFAQVVDQSAESASRYSVLAAGAGVTNTICPGGATATFPTAGSYVVFGTGSSNAATTGMGNWYLTTTTTYAGNVHAMCATCIENSTESADGSWTLLQGVLASAADSYMAMSFMHTDGSEDGDLDPYVHLIPNGAALYANTRTAFTTSWAPTFPYLNVQQMCTNSTYARGWRRRGFASADAYQDFQFGSFVGNGGALTVNLNAAYPAKVANHPNPNMPVRDAFHVASTGPAAGPLKMRKGYARWWFVTEGGFCNRLLLNGAYVQVGGSSVGPLVAGPWDGTTTPVNGI